MNNKKIEFEFGGKTYSMTAEEIEAAYRYKERQYLKEDALRQLNQFIFDEDDPEDEGAIVKEEKRWSESISLFTYKEKKQWFESIYLITYEEACGLLDDFVDTFEEFSDCNVDENQTWHDAIEKVLEEVGKNGGKTDRCA